MTTLITYSQEIGPMLRKQFELQDALKEWKAVDAEAQRLQNDIKDAQEALKKYVEDTEGNLVKEITDLALDVKLALNGAAKGTNYKPAELKAFFTARARESVAKVVDKGELFAQLDAELA